MKSIVREKIDKALKSVFKEKLDSYDILIPEREEFGDFSSNAAFLLSKKLGKKPYEIAEQITNFMRKDSSGIFEKVQVAGGGFVNFFISHNIYQKEINTILKRGKKYGNSEIGKKKKVQIEFISANPTGPLTVANGRGGFTGDLLANVLKKNDFKISREYYVNDFGNQVKVVLAKSVKRQLGLDVEIEEGEEIYSGEYIEEIARKVRKEKGVDWTKKSSEKLGEFAADFILKNYIKKDVKYVGIKFDRWFKESELYSKKIVNRMWNYLKDKKLVYEAEGAYWLKTSEYGDEKDRVIKTSDGNFTYLMSDIAYLYERLVTRKLDQVIMIVGADHHGYLGRIYAAEKMLGFEGRLKIIICQLVKLERNGQEVRMSKRKGNFITLKEVADEIGIDATRYFFVSKNMDNHMVIDLDLAKEESSNNPIYYIQYASARINSVLKKSKPKGSAQKSKKKEGTDVFDKHELALIRKISQYPDLVTNLGESYEVYRLAFYALDLAEALHKFYDNCRIIGDDREEVRLKILKATKVVIEDCLGLMGIVAKEKM